MNHEIFIFGSMVRGEVSRTSDCDILVIPDGDVDRSLLPESWSVYHRQTIKEFYEKGRLFAWHLHLEGQCVFSARDKNWLEILGTPHSYNDAKEDVGELSALLSESLNALRGGSNSEVYELGICYTALRDIAMSASWSQLGRPSFSRNAPYYLQPPLPLSEQAYASAMNARHFSTRGGSFPSNVQQTVVQFLEAPLLEWAQTLWSKL